MAQLRVILDTGYLVFDNLPDFLTDAFVVGLYFLLHPVVAILVGDILLAGIRLSIWVLIEVDFSRWLIVMLCRFCNTFPKRSDRIFAVSPTT